MFNSKRQKVMSYIVSGIYVILLTWLILLKFSTDISVLSHVRSINIIPFHYDTDVSFTIHIKEVLYNIIVFVPLGLYVCIFKPRWPFLLKALPGLCVSLLYETIQFIFAIGMSDITDVIGNTLGGILGIVLFWALKKLFKDGEIIFINICGLTIEVLGTAMLAILTFANM